jgi:hypothetical protein
VFSPRFVRDVRERTTRCHDVAQSVVRCLYLVRESCGVPVPFGKNGESFDATVQRIEA